MPVRATCTPSGALIMCGSAPSASPAGEDPLAERKCDLDSVAGVLKLYFRSLESPLVPLESTGQLLEHARTLCSVCVRMSRRRESPQRVCFITCFFIFMASSPSEIKNEAERAAQLKAVISSFPEPIVIVMRYLFAFLHQWVFESVITRQDVNFTIVWRQSRIYFQDQDFKNQLIIN